MAKTMPSIKDLCVKLHHRLNEGNIKLGIMDLIEVLFLKKTFTEPDEIFFGILLTIALELFKRNYLITDIEEDIKNLELKSLKDDKQYLQLKKCKFRCLSGILYLKIIEEDYLFFFNLLDTIHNIDINIDKTVSFLKEEYGCENSTN